jgi:hypothetical protein
MTTSKTPRNTNPPSDEELEALLRGSWGRSVARAEDDLARGDLVPSALAAGRRRQPRRVAGGAMLGVAAVLVVGFALLVGSGARREPVEPPASPAGPVGSPVAPGSPVPDASTPPGDGEGTPILGPGVTFPPTIDGQAVVTVGPEADATIAAATDDSPIYVSGWIIGADRRGCPNFDSGSPAPNGVMWKECTAIPLRATEDGGATLPVHVSYADEARFPRLPDVTHVLPVLVKVHVHDAGCVAADCAQRPVLDTVVQYGAPLIAPVLRVGTRPPGGITLEQALSAADAYIQQNLIGYGLPLVLLSAEAGPRALVGQGGSMSELGWVWAVRYVSENGSTECTVYVDYLGGSAHESSCESVSFP